MTRTVFLHIGAPKTGTTFLQDRLSRNVGALARHDVHVPWRIRDQDAATFHFRAALDVLGQDWGGKPGHAAGAWPAMVRHVRRAHGTVVISHEILAPAPPEVVDRVMADLSDSEVHLVYSVRDLARQLPAAWQESVKQGRQWKFSRFVERMQKGDAFFMQAFDLPKVLSTWARNLPPERVHVVTVPPSGAPHDELWRRFARALAIDPAWAPRSAERANASLGVAETEMLRRLNRRIGREARIESTYDQLIRRLLDDDQLTRVSPRVELSPHAWGWAEEQTARWVDWIEGSGVDLVGDLADLEMGDPPTDWVDPDKVSARQLARAALDALTVMTEEAARRPDPDAQITTRVRNQAERLRRR